MSLIAGLATGIGGIIAIRLKKFGNRVVSFSMGLASGVMLLVAFNNLFLESTKLLTHLELIAMFSLGAITMMTLDLTIPHIELATKREESIEPSQVADTYSLSLCRNQS